jgi:adenylate kinase
MRLLIVGPPGAGKGTQAQRLAQHFGVPAISTGDIFRSNIAQGTQLGRQVQATLESGGYVSDEITNELVRERLAQPDTASGFLLDGYPRTAAQVAELDAMLAVSGGHLDAVAELQVDSDELVSRLVQRAVVEGRPDDTEEVIRRRQEIYQLETAPLIDHYRLHGLLVSVDGLGDVDQVGGRLADALDAAVPGRACDDV